MSGTTFVKSTKSLLCAAAITSLAGLGLWLGTPDRTVAAGDKESSNVAPAATFAGTGFGAIPDRPTAGCGGAPGAPRDITFNVTGLSGAPTSVAIESMTFSPNHSWMTDVTATLIAPNGASHTLFGRTVATTATACGDSSPLAGPYAFSDSAASPPSGGWWQAATAATGTTPVASGTYRTTNSGGAGATNPMPATNMNPAFTGVTSPNGTWTLRLTDDGGGDTGSISAATLNITAGPAVALDANADINGDGRTDWILARGNAAALAANGEQRVGRNFDQASDIKGKRNGDGGENALGGAIQWYAALNNPAGTNTVAIHGDTGTDTAIIEDFDGDGRDDYAVWTAAPATQAAFRILQSSTNTIRTEVFGQDGDDAAVVGDYDGDGRADPAVFRCPPFSGAAGQCFFYYRGSLNNPSGAITFVPWGFGREGDLFPNVGDFDGDGRNDFCLQRSNPAAPTNGQFVLLRSSNLGVEFINWGLNGDFILPGDYDGDGRSDFCIRRTVSGQRQHWILTRAGTTSVVNFGITGDQSVPGDYDGDGRTDIAIWRSSATANESRFWVLNSGTNQTSNFVFGSTGDVAVAGWSVK